jgi:hypothetical protein
VFVYVCKNVCCAKERVTDTAVVAERGRHGERRRVGVCVCVCVCVSKGCWMMISSNRQISPLSDAVSAASAAADDDVADDDAADDDDGETVLLMTGL